MCESCDICKQSATTATCTICDLYIVHTIQDELVCIGFDKRTNNTQSFLLVGLTFAVVFGYSSFGIFDIKVRYNHVVNDHLC